mgnify:CR=1 FL=1|jgi:hypothetical protein
MSELRESAPSAGDSAQDVANDDPSCGGGPDLAAVKQSVPDEEPSLGLSPDVSGQRASLGVLPEDSEVSHHIEMELSEDQVVHIVEEAFAEPWAYPQGTCLPTAPPSTYPHLCLAVYIR